MARRGGVRRGVAARVAAQSSGVTGGARYGEGGRERAALHSQPKGARCYIPGERRGALGRGVGSGFGAECIGSTAPFLRSGLHRATPGPASSAPLSRAPRETISECTPRAAKRCSPPGLTMSGTTRDRAHSSTYSLLLQGVQSHFHRQFDQILKKELLEPYYTVISKVYR